MRTTYIGMDIHKDFIQAVAMDKHGNILKEQKFETEKERKKKMLKFYHSHS